MSDSPYDVLGVPPNADAETIDAAYRRRARQSHPDRNGDKDEFVRVKNAVALLRDPMRRKRYNETGDASDPKLNKWREAVVTIFVSVVQEIINGDQSPSNVAVDKVMRNKIEQDIKAARACLKKIETIERRLTESQKVIADAIRHNLAEARDKIAMLEQASDYLKSCKYKVDKQEE